MPSTNTYGSTPTTTRRSKFELCVGNLWDALFYYHQDPTPKELQTAEDTLETLLRIGDARLLARANYELYRLRHPQTARQEGAVIVGPWAARASNRRGRGDDYTQGPEASPCTS